MSVASPCVPEPSADGSTSTSAVPPRRQAGPAGATAILMPGTAVAAATMAAGLVPAGASTSIGVSTPTGMPACSSITTPSRAAPRWESELTLASPTLMPSAAMPSATRTASPAAAASQRWRTTSLAHAVQPRLGLSSCRSRGHSSRGPMPASTAGTRVSVTATLISGISMPPRPMLRMNGIGSAMSARSPSATVTPLNTMARPGGVHGAADRGLVVVALGQFLAPAGDQQERVVDGNAEADEADQELNDEVDIDEVGQAENGQERGRHRSGRDQQRDDRQQRGKHEGQHGQRTERAEEDLASYARPGARIRRRSSAAQGQ